MADSVRDPGLDETRHGGSTDVAHELRALAAQIGSLQAEVRRLESAPLPREGESGWDDPQLPAAAFRWISSLDAPRRPALRIPRLPVELAFLAGAALLAGLAHLRPLVIAGVMGGAWVIVAAAEWAGSRGDRLRQRLLLEAPARAAAPELVPADPTWFTPPVEHTLLARPSAPAHSPTHREEPDAQAPEAQTIVARLPALPDGETTAEHGPGG